MKSLLLMVLSCFIGGVILGLIFINVQYNNLNFKITKNIQEIEAKKKEVNSKLQYYKANICSELQKQNK